MIYYDDGWPNDPTDWCANGECAHYACEPPSADPCPCCNGNGHEGYCATAVEVLAARLSALMQRPLPEGWTLGAALSHDLDPRSEDLGLSCLRCGDTGVVEVED